MGSNTVRTSASPLLARRRDHPSLHRRVAATDLFFRSPALFMRGMSTRPRGAIVDEDASSTIRGYNSALSQQVTNSVSGSVRDASGLSRFGVWQPPPATPTGWAFSSGSQNGS